MRLTIIDLLINYLICPQSPDFGYGFAKIIQHIRRICFIIFASPRSKSEDFATKIIDQ